MVIPLSRRMKIRLLLVERQRTNLLRLRRLNSLKKTNSLLKWLMTFRLKKITKIQESKMTKIKRKARLIALENIKEMVASLRHWTKLLFSIRYAKP